MTDFSAFLEAFMAFFTSILSGEVDITTALTELATLLSSLSVDPDAETIV